MDLIVFTKIKILPTKSRRKERLYNQNHICLSFLSRQILKIMSSSFQILTLLSRNLKNDCLSQKNIAIIISIYVKQLNVEAFELYDYCIVLLN